MSTIAGNINGVLVECSPEVSRQVDQKIVDTLKHALNTTMGGKSLRKIYLSSENNQLQSADGDIESEVKAINISRINGVKMFVGYTSIPVVTAIVDALQTAIESFPHNKENYGPSIKKKLGKVHNVLGHRDHIRFSVS